MRATITRRSLRGLGRVTVATDYDVYRDEFRVRVTQDKTFWSVGVRGCVGPANTTVTLHRLRAKAYRNLRREVATRRRMAFLRKWVQSGKGEKQITAMFERTNRAIVKVNNSYARAFATR